MIGHRVPLLCVAVASLLALPFAVTAQPESKPDAVERRAPLPNYFGKIAVNDEQRALLYEIQDDYGAKIEALQQQVKSLIKERDGKMQELLTDGQKLRLKELREEARQKAAKRAEEADSPEVNADGTN